ncbi:2-hydroxyacyl-CoA dehydratase subunit D [Candidatus Methanoliparum sp. LAM-1]|uniref:2-hydroxyacyl-CoA dehydratase subunit D n=1 Tax=Candidatus Methanoliparum sp. LAM-1 TaxID=2874846 RepID=UPI001E40A2D8|nr:2-hydroxyacyl-CoA dehydratase family protein [Candidatus Methanoliparum sp. LAM-1]BDC35457.1 hypothetical protein MTLP_01390 [Candidatus Methanoliparum sp. LAM-1]
MQKQKVNLLGFGKLFGPTYKKHLERQNELIEKKRPCGWFFGYHPSELNYVFDIVNIFPEQYSAYCASRGDSPRMIDDYYSMGYGPFLCDYFKCSIAAIDKPELATKPLMPRPDFTVDHHSICFGHRDMAEIHARMYGVKRYSLAFPYIRKEDIGSFDDITKITEWMDKDLLEYTIQVLRDFVTFLEEVTGEDFDDDKFKSVMKVSEETSRYFIEIFKLFMSKPTPGSQIDLANYPFIGFFVHGSKYGLDYVKNCYELIKERVNKKEGVVPEEKFRLMTHGIMPWHTLSLYNYLEESGATFPLNPYAHCSAVLHDSTKPFESLARRVSTFCNVEHELMLDALIKKAKDADLDGAILFENTGCRIVSGVMRPIKKALYEELGIPSLIVEAPQCDSRAMPPERMKTQFDAFIESLR